MDGRVGSGEHTQPLQQATQDLSRRDLHVQRERNHALDYHGRLHVALPLAGAIRFREDPPDSWQLEALGDYARRLWPSHEAFSLAQCDARPA